MGTEDEGDEADEGKDGGSGIEGAAHRPRKNLVPSGGRRSTWTAAVRSAERRRRIGREQAMSTMSQRYDKLRLHGIGKPS